MVKPGVFDGTINTGNAKTFRVCAYYKKDKKQTALKYEVEKVEVFYFIFR